MIAGISFWSALKQKIAPIIKGSRLLNGIRRFYSASKYYNAKYLQIARWVVNSREDTNYTYSLTSDNMSYMAATIALITGASPWEVYGYMVEAENDQALRDHVRRKVLASSSRSVADEQVHFGRRLGWYAFVRILKPRIVVETGVDKGHGSVLLCAALKRNNDEGFDGRYFGTDINPNAGLLLADLYANYGEIVYGDSIDTLENFTELIDIFINDSDHSPDYEYREYQAIKHKLSPQAVIIGDNAHVSDRLFVFAQETGRNFLFHREVPEDHWYPGGGLGVAF